MADGGGWEDLFAMAAGDESSTVDISSKAAAGTKRQQHPTDIDTKSTAKKKAKKKKKKKIPKDRHQRLKLERMLESRMDISHEATRHWPVWVRPGGSLLAGTPSSCPRYVGSYDASDDGNYDPRKKRTCSSCGGCPLHHELVVDTRDGPGLGGTCAYDHLNVFLSNRNVRACASIALAEQRKARRRGSKKTGGDINTDDADNNANYALIRAYARAALHHVKEITSKLLSLTSTLLSSGEASILEGKCSALHRAVAAWRSGRDGAPADFDTIIRVIIASDELYYRLYYLQLIEALPISTSGAYIPHPTNYFVADRLCWDTVGGTRCVSKFLKRGGKIPEIMKEYSTAATQSKSSTVQFQHPLLLLKSNRFAETVLLFGDWTEDVQTKSRFAKAVKSVARSLSLQSSTSQPEDAFYAAHECPAPKVLMEWRNVCRDLLCNLYAYATVSVDHLESHPICASAGILEVGAGTGYYASLLQMAGIDARPSDIANTDASMNEYHGSTPSFTRVETGDIVKLKNDLLRQRELHVPALLLCYPPPLTSMAHDALRTFIEAGGNIVIHIGEFEGLTGSLAFERLLLDKFRCVRREPCFSWSTDASSLTVWEAAVAGNASTASAHVLIPCSNCGSKPATKRFRLIRSLAYCGEECYKEHKSERLAHALCSMIPVDVAERARFDDEAYVVALSR